MIKIQDYCFKKEAIMGFKKYSIYCFYIEVGIIELFLINNTNVKIEFSLKNREKEYNKYIKDLEFILKNK